MLTDNELAELIMTLRTLTPFGRVNIAEAEVVFAKIADLGYTIAKPAAAPALKAAAGQ